MGLRKAGLISDLRLRCNVDGNLIVSDEQLFNKIIEMENKK